MKGFLVSVVAVVVISLLFEVIFPAKRLKGMLSLLFGLGVIFLLSGGVKDIFSGEKTNFFSQSITLQNDELLESTVAETERALCSRLNSKGFGVTDVTIHYEVDELRINYNSVELRIEGEEDIEKLKDAVEEIIDIERGDIWVRS